MKRIILVVLMGMLTHLSVSAQERVVLRMEDFVKVYIDAYKDDSFCQLLPLSKLASDLSYNAIILEKKGDRFKLIITLSDILCDIESEPIIGWVDSKDCGVFLLCNKYDGSVPILNLYESPSLESYVETIDISSIIRFWISITDIYNGFVKVSFEIHGNIYRGWISRYCTDPYSLCT